MNDPKNNSEKESKRVENLKKQEADQLFKEKVRKKAFLAREQEIEKRQVKREAERAEILADEEIKDLAKEKARKEAYLAREKAIADAQEARRRRDKTPPPK